MLKSVDYNSKHFHFFTLAGILVLNLILKTSFCGAEPFWYDEIVSVKSALLDFGHIKHVSEWDNNPPFYYYCLWVWIKLFGVSEFKVRLLSILFSTATALVLFVFLKKNFTYLTALSASLFFTFHSFCFEYSQEARCYSLVVLLVLCSCVFFFRFLQKASAANAVLLGLFNFLVIYTHYIAGLIILIQFLFIVILYKKNLNQYSLSILLCLILTALRFTKKQILVMLSFNKEGKEFWLQTADSNLLRDALSQLFSGNKIWIVFLFLFLLSVIFVFIRKAGKDPLAKHILIYSAIMSLGYISIIYFIGLMKPVFLGRYLLFTVPFIFILISWFLSQQNKPLKLLILPLLFIQVYYLDVSPEKPMDYRQAVSVVNKLRGSSNAMVIVQTKDLTSLFAYYYNREHFMDFKNQTDNLIKNKVFDIESSTDLGTLPYINEDTIILCQTFEKEGDSNQIFNIFKQNNYVFATTKTVKGVKISLLKKLKLYEK